MSDGETRAERRKRGEKALAAVNDRAHRIPDLLADVAPDYANLVTEFAYGDVFSRPGLDVRTRELTIIAGLTALGTTATTLALRIHLRGALLVGVPKTEIVETIMQMMIYAGFPAAQNALLLAKEVFEEFDKK